MGKGDTAMTNEEAYEMGKKAESICENPFWKDYPKNPVSDDATFARYFVDGWIKKEEKCLK